MCSRCSKGDSVRHDDRTATTELEHSQHQYEEQQLGLPRLDLSYQRLVDILLIERPP